MEQNGIFARKERRGNLVLAYHPELDLKAEELDTLHEQFNADKEEYGMEQALFNLIGRAYKVGLATGEANSDTCKIRCKDNLKV